MALAFLAALALAFLFVWPEDLGLDEDGFTLPEMEQQSSVSASKFDSGGHDSCPGCRERPSATI